MTCFARGEPQKKSASRSLKKNTKSLSVCLLRAKLTTDRGAGASLEGTQDATLITFSVAFLFLLAGSLKPTTNQAAIGS